LSVFIRLAVRVVVSRLDDLTAGIGVVFPCADSFGEMLVGFVFFADRTFRAPCAARFAQIDIVIGVLVAGVGVHFSMAVNGYLQSLEIVDEALFVELGEKLRCLCLAEPPDGLVDLFFVCRREQLRGIQFVDVLDSEAPEKAFQASDRSVANPGVIVVFIVLGVGTRAFVGRTKRAVLSLEETVVGSLLEERSDFVYPLFLLKIRRAPGRVDGVADLADSVFDTRRFVGLDRKGKEE
jgi:hypothetical protein